MVLCGKGAAVTSPRRLVNPPMSSFCFCFLFFGHVFAAAPAWVVLLLYRRLYGGRYFIYKAGHKPILRKSKYKSIISNCFCLVILHKKLLW